jgi:general secretion pathway protein J
MGDRWISTDEADDGYTLIELLISLTILALLLAMVPSTLRLGKRAWETPGGLDEAPAAAALSFAGQQLKSALPVYQLNDNGLPQMVFEGTPQRVSFIAELQSGPFGGGLYRVDVGQPRSAGGISSGAAVRLTLYRPEKKIAPVNTEERDLSSTYSEVNFRYFGSPAPGAAAQWQSTWPRADRLPDLIDLVATSRAPAKAADAQIRAELKLRPLL